MPPPNAHSRRPGRPSSRRVYVILATLLVLGGVFAFHFATDTAGTSPADGGHADAATAFAASVESGRVLAGQFCQSCHQLPDPALLDAKTWRDGVLPTMGPRLGIFRHGPADYSRHKYDWGLGFEFFPTSPLLGESQWQSIINYYVASAPDKLPPQSRAQRIEMGLPLFAVEAPRGAATREPFTCFVKVHEGGESWKLIVSDSEMARTQFLDGELRLVDSIETAGPVVNAEVGAAGGVLLCNIGKLTPNNGAAGKAQRVTPGIGGAPNSAEPVTILEGLRRPVQITPADLNGDGAEDYLVCEFGSLLGGLSWMEQTATGKFKKHAMSDLPGAVKAWVRDHNGDGKPDVWALFSQGQEGVFVFTNQGGGRFRAEQVLQFPASYGSSYFEPADFNADGHPDLVYTAGDNGDQSRILKPYHGVYIYLNDGTNHFEQDYFFPIHGCYKVLARDFDGDDDLDLATISCFADDPTQPEEGFVYFENVGAKKDGGSAAGDKGLSFRPISIEQAKHGRWMSMDAGDVDADGDVDLVLGNFAMPSPTRPALETKAAPPFLLLRNQRAQP